MTEMPKGLSLSTKVCEKMSEEQIWLIVGFIGQTIFASRFLIQWVVSERASKSIIPNIFWWINFFGWVIGSC